MESDLFEIISMGWTVEFCRIEGSVCARAWYKNSTKREFVVTAMNVHDLMWAVKTKVLIS